MKSQRRFQRIVFIEPKSTHIHVYSTVHIPRMGGILLATILQERGYDVTVIVEDMLRKRITEDMVWHKLREADLLCISSITPTANRCYMWGDRARAAGIPVVIGGTHVTYFPEEALEHADWVMRGEADETFPRFMDVLESGGDFSSVPGLTWRDGGLIRHNPDAPLPSSKILEANPFPNFDLIWEANLHGNVASFAVARGCPYNCSFCSVTKFNGAAVRTVSAERTLDMIEDHWNRYHPRYIFFAEDIFNQMKTRAKQIMRGLIERKIRPTIGFGAQMRHEVVHDKEFLELMREAGFDRAMVGFESINQASLDLCGKRETVEQVEFAIKEFHRYKIKVHGMFVIGFDTDTPQTYHDTLEFVKRLDLDSFQLMLLTPLPGTRDWHSDGFGDGRRPLLTRDWNKYDGHHMVQVPKLMTAYEANRLALETMRKFYSLPRAFSRLLRGDWVEFLMRFEGHLLIKKWYKTPENRQWLEYLRRQLEEPKEELAAKLKKLQRRVLVAHTEASLAFRETIDRFFTELGVKVEHSRSGLGELVATSHGTLAGLRDRITDYLADKGLLKRDKVDFVVVPMDLGSATKIEPLEIDADAPPVIRLNINQQARVLAEQCVQLALAYTDDIIAAADTFRRIMLEQMPQAQPAMVTVKS
ncbi:MAG: B12-binding domain-containing radical SAM protein [Candidatus Sumerlaeaceae bacterium]